MKNILLLVFATIGLVACGSNNQQEKDADGASANSTELKPRLVIMTDIGPAEVEPDDNESAVRLLAYADRFEIEAMITSIGWNCDPYPTEWADYLKRVVDAYGTDVNNLMKRSQQTRFMAPELEDTIKQKLGYWPSVDYLRKRTLMGSQRAGIGVIGPDNDTDGSRKIIELLDEPDPRPIFFCAWGGANTLAQAVWRLQQERSEVELLTLLHKIRLYTITDQDMQYSMRMDRAYSSHLWLRQEFANDLMLIWDESAWLNQNELGKQNWSKYVSLIQGKGAMGKVYPTFKWGVEGDTPSFLHCMPNGLNDPSDPTQVGWGGLHEFRRSPDSITMAWTNWDEPVKEISNKYEHRFYPDEFNDFAARMQWAEEGKGNTNPTIVINGNSSVAPLHIVTKAGTIVALDATHSFDAEGDSISFHWWQQTEGGLYPDPVEITNDSYPLVQLTIPQDAEGFKIHFICEARDNSTFQLVSYRRIIVEVQ